MWSDENEEELLTLIAEVEKLHSQTGSSTSNECDKSVCADIKMTVNIDQGMQQQETENQTNQTNKSDSACETVHIKQTKEQQDTDNQTNQTNKSDNLCNTVHIEQTKQQRDTENQTNQTNKSDNLCDPVHIEQTKDQQDTENQTNKRDSLCDTVHIEQTKEQQDTENQINQTNKSDELCDTVDIEQTNEQQDTENQTNQTNKSDNLCDTVHIEQTKEQQDTENQTNQTNTNDNLCETVHIEQTKEQQDTENQTNQTNKSDNLCDTVHTEQTNEQQDTENQTNQTNKSDKLCGTVHIEQTNEQQDTVNPTNQTNKSDNLCDTVHNEETKEQQGTENQTNQTNKSDNLFDSVHIEQTKEQQDTENQTNQTNKSDNLCDTVHIEQTNEHQDTENQTNQTNKSDNLCDNVHIEQTKEQQDTENHGYQQNVSDKSADNFQGSETEIEERNVRRDSKKRTRKKRIPTRKKLKYISSSDDDIPLSVYANRNVQLNNSDNGDDLDFIPTSKDMNSTDSEFSSDLSESSKKRRKKEKALKKTWSDTIKHIKSNKRPRTTRKQRMTETPLDNNSTRGASLEEVMTSSYNEEMLRHTLIDANKGRLDQFLNSEGLKRDEVPPHGNCFFEAACKSNLITESHAQLRTSLCNHLEDNALEYMGFIINKYNPKNEEDFIIEYLTEIENLKQDGYWSSKVADLLPLSLANYVNCSVTIYTSKPDKQKILIEPTLKTNEDKHILNLAYISIPNVLEHYDACTFVDVPTDGQSQFVATPVPTGSPSIHASTTPKKAAKFVSPKKKKLFRKRKATPDNWKKNIRKRLRLNGEQYVTPLGKVVPKKTVKNCDCTKCRYKCNLNISDEKRLEIRNSYYALDSYERQKDYLCANVHEMKTKTLIREDGEKIQKKKQVHRIFSFEVNNERVRVCKKFFLRTIDISEAMVVQALSKKMCGHYEGRDERGRHTPANKTSNEQLQYIKHHIESFPTVESHYVRKSTKRQFLAPNLSVKKMYEQYVVKCEENEQVHVNEPVYRRVFNEEYNLSFHVPKKDQCQLCNKYETAKADGTLDDTLKDTYNNHQENKEIARDQKNKDSALARQDKKVKTCTFDLQSVLYTPCSLVSLMYYMRKLCCYNLSIYSAGDKHASCFLWSEIDGKRGSNEISTCLNLYLQSLATEVEHVILYSDSCAGQNKNQIVATCLNYTVQTVPSLKIIDHKFLESGHTHMECDSMHAAIEFAKSQTRIFVPGQWETVLSMARRNNPYHVVTLKHYDFKDFKDAKIKPNTKTQNGQTYKWREMKWIRFTKDEPELCLFKNSFDESEEFQKVKMPGSKRLSETNISPLYKGKLPISGAKRKDLISLCKQGAIPSEFHDYYKGLSSSQNVQDRLPEPDLYETENETDTE